MLHYNRQYLTVAADKDIEEPEQKSVLELDLIPVTAKRILREIIDADDADDAGCFLPAMQKFAWLSQGLPASKFFVV